MAHPRGTGRGSCPVHRRDRRQLQGAGVRTLLPCQESEVPRPGRGRACTLREEGRSWVVSGPRRRTVRIPQQASEVRPPLVRFQFPGTPSARSGRRPRAPRSQGHGVAHPTSSGPWRSRRGVLGHCRGPPSAPTVCLLRLPAAPCTANTCVHQDTYSVVSVDPLFKKSWNYIQFGSKADSTLAHFG